MIWSSIIRSDREGVASELKRGEIAVSLGITAKYLRGLGTHACGDRSVGAGTKSAASEPPRAGTIQQARSYLVRPLVRSSQGACRHAMSAPATEPMSTRLLRT
jgi:hypothetical protein